MGRKLVKGSFEELSAQLRPGEILIGVYYNQTSAMVGTHLYSERRMEEMESLYSPSEGYYALQIEAANKGMNPPIPIAFI